MLQRVIDWVGVGVGWMWACMVAELSVSWDCTVSLRSGPAFPCAWEGAGPALLQQQLANAGDGVGGSCPKATEGWGSSPAPTPLGPVLLGVGGGQLFREAAGEGQTNPPVPRPSKKVLPWSPVVMNHRQLRSVWPSNTSVASGGSPDPGHLHCLQW